MTGTPTRWRPFRVALAAAPLFVAVMLGAYGCDTSLPGDEVCRDVGYSIAAKVYECSGDVDRSNAAYEDLTSKHTCLVHEVGEDQNYEKGSTDFTCSQNLLKLTCEQVAAFGSDYSRWLAAADCGAIYTGPGGTPLPEAGTGDAADGGDGGDGGPVTPAFTLQVEGTIDGEVRSFDCTTAPTYSTSGGELFRTDCTAKNAPGTVLSIGFTKVELGKFVDELAKQYASVSFAVGQSKITPAVGEFAIEYTQVDWAGPGKPMGFGGKFTVSVPSPAVDMVGTFSAVALQPK